MGKSASLTYYDARGLAATANLSTQQWDGDNASFVLWLNTVMPLTKGTTPEAIAAAAAVYGLQATAPTPPAPAAESTPTPAPESTT